MAHKRNSKKPALTLFTFAALGLILLTSVRVYAQVSGATMTGTVNDATGAVIPNAQLSIQNVATGEVRGVTTDKAGFYTAPNLLPGSYEVTVTAPGFSTEVRSGITLTVGAQQVLKITMNVGQISQKVEVSGEAPAVQLANSTIAGVVSQNAHMWIGRELLAELTLLFTQRLDGFGIFKCSQAFAGNRKNFSGCVPGTADQAGTTKVSASRACGSCPRRSANRSDHQQRG